MVRGGPKFKAASSRKGYLGDSLENGRLSGGQVGVEMIIEPDLSGDVEGKSLSASLSAFLKTPETIRSG